MNKVLKYFSMLCFAFTVFILSPKIVEAGTCAGGNCPCPGSINCSTQQCDSSCGGHKMDISKSSNNNGCVSEWKECSYSYCSLQHNYGTTHTAMTCTSSNHTQTCTTGYSHDKKCGCGTNRETCSKPALGHLWTNWVYSSPKNYDGEDIADRQRDRDCSRCGAAHETEWHNYLKVRYMKADGTWSMNDTVILDLWEKNTGALHSWSRPEDTDPAGWQAASTSWYAGAKPHVEIIDVPRRGWMFEYNNNTGQGTIAGGVAIPGKTYNLSDGTGFSKKGYLFKGWSEDKATTPGTDVTGDFYNLGKITELIPGTPTYYSANYEHKDLHTPGERHTFYAVWYPIRYNVRYVDGQGNSWLDPTSATTEPRGFYYDNSYTPRTQKDTGFTKTGYYIKYWRYATTKVHYTSHDVDWPVGTSGIQAQYKNLTDVSEATVDLEATWEPIKYTLRIHENWPKAGTADNYIDYTLTYDSNFKLPPNPFSRTDGIMLGYDFDKTVKVTPKYTFGDNLINLTTTRNDVIDIYCIWDLAPTVKLKDSAPAELHLRRSDVLGFALNTNSTTISKSDLEAYLMSFVTAEDNEWTSRGWGANVSSGSKNGYKFGISAINPGEVRQNVKDMPGSAYTYYITYECADDVGQSSTLTWTVLVGSEDFEEIDILVR